MLGEGFPPGALARQPFAAGSSMGPWAHAKSAREAKALEEGRQTTILSTSPRFPSQDDSEKAAPGGCGFDRLFSRNPDETCPSVLFVGVAVGTLYDRRLGGIRRVPPPTIQWAAWPSGIGPGWFHHLVLGNGRSPAPAQTGGAAWSGPDRAARSPRPLDVTGPLVRFTCPDGALALAGRRRHPFKFHHLYHAKSRPWHASGPVFTRNWSRVGGTPVRWLSLTHIASSPPGRFVRSDLPNRPLTAAFTYPQGQAGAAAGNGSAAWRAVGISDEPDARGAFDYLFHLPGDGPLPLGIGPPWRRRLAAPKGGASAGGTGQRPRQRFAIGA